MPRMMTTADGRQVPDPRATWEWRQLAIRVIGEEPACWLQLDGCTQISTTGDHVVPVSQRPDLGLVRSNVHGACAPCNRKRNNLSISEMRLGGQTKPAALSVFE